MIVEIIVYIFRIRFQSRDSTLLEMMGSHFMSRKDIEKLLCVFSPIMRYEKGHNGIFSKHAYDVIAMVLVNLRAKIFTFIVFLACVSWK